MAIPHAASGDLMDIRPLGATLRQTPSSTLVRVDHLEVLRLVLPKGKVAAEHRAAGAITIQCSVACGDGAGGFVAPAHPAAAPGLTALLCTASPCRHDIVYWNRARSFMSKKQQPSAPGPVEEQPLKTGRPSPIVAPPDAQGQRSPPCQRDIESALDEALEESFPASDSPSILLA